MRKRQPITKAALRGVKSLRLFAALLASALMCNSQRGVLASAGDLDTTFGGDGKVTTDFFGFYDGCGDVAIQQDGKIIVGGGASRDTIRIDFALARYNQNGTLDSSFGSGGKVNTTFPFSAGISGISKIAIQPNGKIVAVGSTYGTGFYDFALARYNIDGSLDSTFGTQGLVATDFFGEYDSINSLALQTDGKIVVGGAVSKMDSFFQNRTDFGLARYNVDGTLDSSFGVSGSVIGDFTESRVVNGIDIRSDGKLIMVGGVSISNQSSIFITRRNTDGSLDTSFGSNGTVTYPSLTGVILGVGAFATQSDGKIVLGGPSVDGLHSYYSLAMARINVDGSLDTSFGSAGLAKIDFGSNTQIHSIAVQPNGKIVTAGEVIVNQNSLDFGLSRVEPNGSVDLTFGGNGTLTIDFFDSYDIANGLAVQNDGKIVAVGFARNNINDNDFALVRLNGDATFDICTQDESTGYIFRINSTTGDYQFTNCSGFTLTGIGSLIRRGGVITLQHYASDRRILAKIDTGVSKGTVLIQLFSPSTTFTITDRNTSNNSCACAPQ